ncbi:MAG TPA: hypothetical protein VGX03_13395 [Candidatus Binatia bacterium]|nr:hypothetical protein [Candidatus Binatia bacterium]
MTWRHIIGAVCVAIGLGATVIIGVLSSSDKPPSGREAASLVTAAALFQLAGAGFLHQSGKADPGHAKSSVRRLVRIGRRARAAEIQANEVLEKGTAGDMKRILGEITVSLSVIQEDALDAMADWEHFHTQAVADAVEGIDSGTAD